jgi:catechol 2,3-dioxygenase-like lactoylglutathione lyase family enzyme
MKALRHTGIVVKDLEKMLHFYADLLGLSVVKRMDESSTYIDLLTALKGVSVTTVKLSAKDASVIELLYFRTHPANAPGEKGIASPGISHVAFSVNDVDFEYQRLLKAGIVFLSSPQRSPDGFAKVVFCKDYENNLIELVQEL